MGKHKFIMSPIKGLDGLDGGDYICDSAELIQTGNSFVLAFRGKDGKKIAQFDLYLSDPNCPVEDKSADIARVWE